MNERRILPERDEKRTPQRAMLESGRQGVYPRHLLRSLLPSLCTPLAFPLRLRSSKAWEVRRPYAMLYGDEHLMLELITERTREFWLHL